MSKYTEKNQRRKDVSQTVFNTPSARQMRRTLGGAFGKEKAVTKAIATGEIQLDV